MKDRSLSRRDKEELIDLMIDNLERRPKMSRPDRNNRKNDKNK